MTQFHWTRSFFADDYFTGIYIWDQDMDESLQPKFFARCRYTLFNGGWDAALFMLQNGWNIISRNCMLCNFVSMLSIKHYCDVIMGAMASIITSPTSVYSTFHSGADQRKHQSSASLAFVRGIHQRSVNSPHKRPVPPKMFPFDDVIMANVCCG